MSSPWTLNAIGYVNHDSGGYISYVSIPGGALNITKFDTVNNLVSGTFELTTYETYPTTDLHNTIGITNGYFNDIPIDQGSYGQGSITALLNGTPFNSDNDGVEMVYTDSEFNGIDLFDYGPEMGNDSFISIQRIPMRTVYVCDGFDYCQKRHHAYNYFSKLGQFAKRRFHPKCRINRSTNDHIMRYCSSPHFWDISIFRR